MVDVSHRVAVIFAHPKSTEEEPRLIGVTIPWLMENGYPKTESGKNWKYHSVELIQ